MTFKLTTGIWTMVLLLVCLGNARGNHITERVSVIFDTDIGPDYDDVGALALLHALAESNRVRILATVSSNKMEKTTRLLYIINRYYGRAFIPVGAAKGILADLPSAKIVFEQWPTRIICSGAEIGRYIRTGDKLIAAETPEGNPVKDTYAVSIKQDILEFDNSRYEMGGRASYDQTAALAAVTGIDTYFDYERGTITIKDDGDDTWTRDPNGRHIILKKKYSFQYMADVIERLMMAPPRLVQR
ncbi:hypothetical protein SAMN05216436_101215 [bacterium A37T11]|nr:hypothetical protein SAMN05216436_101215 [bacterium A37T11]